MLCYLLVGAIRSPHTRSTSDINLQRINAKAKYLISFPSAAMVVPKGELEAVGHDAHAVIEEAKAAGVYVFGGGDRRRRTPCPRRSRWCSSRGRLSVGAHARWRLHCARTAFTRRGGRVGRAPREGLSL